MLASMEVASICTVIAGGKAGITSLILRSSHVVTIALVPSCFKCPELSHWKVL